MTALKMIRRSVGSPHLLAVPLFSILCGCVSSGDSLPSSMYRELGWRSGEETTQVALLDAADHALSLKINGEDFHSYQIKKRWAAGQSYFEQATKPSSESGTHKLCSQSDGLNDWARLGCKAVDADFPLSDKDCQISERCIRIRVAPFVLNSHEYMEAVRVAFNDPCRFVPEYDELKKQHRINEPRGGRTRLGADVSRYWLFCSSGKKVRAVLEGAGDDGAFSLKWSR